MTGRIEGLWKTGDTQKELRDLRERVEKLEQAHAKKIMPELEDLRDWVNHNTGETRDLYHKFFSLRNVLEDVQGWIEDHAQGQSD